eukprot:jgi/Psemu1/35395/gm1.35395_g
MATLAALCRHEQAYTTIYNTKLHDLHSLSAFSHSCNAVTHHITGKQMEYCDIIRDPEYKDDWLISGVNELGRLAQGLKFCNIKGTNTIFFIPKSQVPAGGAVSYACIVCTVPKIRNHIDGRMDDNKKALRLEDYSSTVNKDHAEVISLNIAIDTDEYRVSDLVFLF